MEDLLRRGLEISREVSEKVEPYFFDSVMARATGEGKYEILFMDSTGTAGEVQVGTTDDKIEARETARRLASVLDLNFKGLVGEGIVPEEGKDDEATKIKKLTEGLEKLVGEVLEAEGFYPGRDFEWSLGKFNILDPGNVQKIKSVIDRSGQFAPTTVKGNTIEFGTYESKLTEQEDEEEEPPVSEPEEPSLERPPVPKPKKVTDQDEAPEITKEFVGSTEDTYYYMISNETDAGEIEDLQIVDQEGTPKFSAKEKALELTNVPEFLFKAIKEIQIQDIEFGVFDRYLYPYVFEEEEKEDEEELPEEEEQGEAPPEESPKESRNETMKLNEQKEEWYKAVAVVDDLSGLLANLAEIPSDREVATHLIGELKGYLEAMKDKVMESTKTHLIEMKVTDHEENVFDVYLTDDGTMDTVIDINGREFRFDSEFASLWRDEEGTLSEEGLRELALDALGNLEEDEYNELLARGADVEKKEELDIAHADDGKFWVIKGDEDVAGPYDTEQEAHDYISKNEKCKTPEEAKWKAIAKAKKKASECVCHIYDMKDDELVKFYKEMDESYAKAGAGKQLPIDKKEVEEELKKRGLESEIVEGYQTPGRRDGTGPHQRSAQRSRKGNVGRRKECGEKCPNEAKVDEARGPMTTKLIDWMVRNNYKVEQDSITTLLDKLSDDMKVWYEFVAILQGESERSMEEFLREHDYELEPEVVKSTPKDVTRNETISEAFHKKDINELTQTMLDLLK